MADTRSARFLVLHKELDPDDDELTRTRKVRRNFIAEKYAVLIEALYSGKTEQFIETQVKFEDGRTGSVSATLQIWKAGLCGHPPSGLTGVPHDRRCFRTRNSTVPTRRCPQRFRDCPRKWPCPKKKIGDVAGHPNISLRFGGVKALTDISFNVREHEIRSIIGPNGAGKSSMLNCINGVYTPSEGSITFRGQTFSP